MDSFVKKLNDISPRKIEVVEYLDPSKLPEAEKSFENMVTSMSAKGERCNGLVISGHHTGSFGGARAQDNLSIDFMEKLSCDPRYTDWFNGISALWLQGCRTLGAGKIESNDDLASPDFHTQRVGALLEEDHLAQSFSQLNNEFSATLDQDNPLSSRYLRTFPRATVFGWTKTAPGEKSHSEYSVPYHIAHIAMLNDDRKDLFDNPIGEKLSVASATVYTQALVSVLSAQAGPQCGDAAIRGWLSHGKAKDGNMGYDNPDLNAFQALLSTEDKKLLQARIDDCILKTEKDPKKVLTTVDRILKNSISIGYGFNSLYELLQKLPESENEADLALFEKLQNVLKSSSTLQDFLSRKLASPQVGLIRKIDYYAFYRDMTGSRIDSIERLIRSKSMEQLLIKSKKPDDFDLRDYKETLLDSLNKNDLINMDFILKLLDAPLCDLDLLKEISDNLSSLSTEDHFAVLHKLIDHPRANASLLSVLANNVPSEESKERRLKLLTALITSHKADAEVLCRIAKNPMQADEKAHVIKLIVNTATQKSVHFQQKEHDSVSAAIGTIEHSDLKPPEIISLAEKVIAHPSEDNLIQIARAIPKWKLGQSNSQNLLKAVLRGSDQKEAILAAVIQSLANQNHWSPHYINPAPTLEQILASPTSSPNTLDRVVDLFHSTRGKIDNREQLLKLMIAHPKMDKYVLSRTLDLLNPYALSGLSKQEITSVLDFAEKSRLMDSDLAQEVRDIRNMWKNP